MEQVAPNVYIQTSYTGVNVGAVRSPQGIIGIDAPSYPRDARNWVTQLRRLDRKPIQYLILTNSHGDRILNTRWFDAPLLVHKDTSNTLYNYGKRFPTSIIESLTTRNPEKGREISTSPVETPSLSFTHSLTRYQHAYKIELMVAPNAAPGGIWVFFPESGVLFVGDTLVSNQHPFLATANSAAWLTTLHKLTNWVGKVNTIVPGRGPLSGAQAIEPLQHYIQLMQRLVQQLVDEDAPKEETAVLVPKFLPMFPVHNLPIEWIKKQIKLSLAHVYDEIQLMHNGKETL